MHPAKPLNHLSNFKKVYGPMVFNQVTTNWQKFILYLNAFSIKYEKYVTKNSIVY